MEVHRPTIKQQNKSHKAGRHKTKGQIKRQAQGRVSVKTLSKKHKNSTDKQARRSQAQQKRKQKREEVLNKKRSKGGTHGAPILVAVIGLGESVDASSVLEVFKTCDDEATVVTNELGIIHISIPRFRQRLAFITPQHGSLYAALDAVKVADTVLLLVDSDRGIDDYGEYCLSCLMAQSLPTPILACQGLKELPLKRQGEGKKLLLKAVSKLFPDEKLHCVDTAQEGVQLLRVLANHRIKDIGYRDKRPHLLAEDLTFELPSQESPSGTLKLSGYVRGQTLSVNGLLHLPGWGDFQMLQIDAPSDPYKLQMSSENSRGRHNSEVDMEDASNGVRVLERCNPAKQTSLVSVAEVDPMEGEQTWPTEEELAEAEAEAKERKTLKRVPKGTSEYQAAWIVDDATTDVTDDADDDSGDDSMDEDQEADMEEEEDSEDNEDDDDVDDESSMGGEKENRGNMGEEYETISVRFGEEVRYDNTMDMAEEEAMLAKYKEARQQEMFPDEVDTPQDVSARVRFQKYRGLKSFRTSPWDAKENLPIEYAKIFQFENFNRTRKKVMKLRDETQGAMPGWYVTVHIADVPKQFMESYSPGTPVVAFGLLEHEQKMSVCNYMLRRTQTHGRPIKSKEEMVFHVGFRRFSACPIYSQHTNGDKHKFERFFGHGTVTAATVFAPITFPTAPVLMFKQMSSGRHELVATGSLLSVNPDRIIAKRIVLSGHPFRISKKQCTVRYMFFNREDIQWFKPVELRTKWGRRGHIKDMLGTHGHMKCVFDGQLKSQDTVLMNLYKRMFPKWTYNARVQTPQDSTEAPVRDTHLDELASEMFDETAA